MFGSEWNECTEQVAPTSETNKDSLDQTDNEARIIHPKVQQCSQRSSRQDRDREKYSKTRIFDIRPGGFRWAFDGHCRHLVDQHFRQKPGEKQDYDDHALEKRVVA